MRRTVFLGRVLRRALRHERVLDGDEGAVAQLALDRDLAAGAELVRDRAGVDDRHGLRRAALDVAQPEAKAAAVGVALVAGLDAACERDDALLRAQLARRERGRAAARDRGVEQEDREHRRDRERDDEPRRIALPSHARIVARLGGLGGTCLVDGVRCSFRGKDAGSVDSCQLSTRLRTPHRDEQRGPSAQRPFRQALPRPNGARSRDGRESGSRGRGRASRGRPR